MMFKCNIKQLTQQISKIESELETTVSAALEHISLKAAEVARNEKTYTSWGGNDLEHNTVPIKNSALSQGIVANKFYASWVEFGNGPPGSRIYPTSASCLHFWIGGQEIFAKSVAASAPHPFMKFGLEYMKTGGVVVMEQYIANFFGSL